MKLNPRTGLISPEEVTILVQTHLEEKFKCEVKVFPKVDTKTVYDKSDWQGQYPPSEVAEFLGYRFELIEG